MVNRVAIRWSKAANMPIRSCRFKVGCPARMPANGEAESISAFVSYVEIQITHQPRHGLPLPIRLPPDRPAYPAPHDQTRRPGRPRPAHRRPLPDARHDPRGDQHLHHPPPAPGRPHQHPVHRRRPRLIHDTSRGKPRTVNNLALAALVATCATGKKLVDESAARAAVTEVIATE